MTYVLVYIEHYCKCRAYIFLNHRNYCKIKLRTIISRKTPFAHNVIYKIALCRNYLRL